MVEIEMDKRHSGREFDDALQLFLDSFLEAHPKEAWPSWFKACTTYGGHKEDNHHWRFSFTAVPSSALGPGESWEETKNGGYVLTRTDPGTGEKRCVISNTPSAVITIFEAIVDLVAQNVLIISDQDLAKINGEDLLPLRK